MSDMVHPEMPDRSDEAKVARKPWVPALVIVSEARDTEAHVTKFTDGTSVTHNIQYGS